MGAHDDPTFGALAQALERIKLYELESEQYRKTLAAVCSERDDYRAKSNRLEAQIQSLIAQSAFWRQQAETFGAALGRQENSRHIDSRIVSHLQEGEGRLVLAEHETEDALAQVLTPSVEVLRTIVSADMERVALVEVSE